MFDWFYWSSIAEGLAKLPKEVVIGGVVAYVVIDVHKRNCEVKIKTAEAEVRKRELELELAKYKQMLENELRKPC